ncbi:hypothetical protein BpHYR1_028231 [Brachionus plicatilis]|uniref:Uncharacterized protein n=1 Tax=Brachionus plicatilis TaxID=10195 RepID=A0A3M7R6N6_BRAPC|nr:hypothetical protein BpHYR1_028231 [Brachionus plicatilis]
MVDRGSEKNGKTKIVLFFLKSKIAIRRIIKNYLKTELKFLYIFRKFLNKQFYRILLQRDACTKNQNSGFRLNITLHLAHNLDAASIIHIPEFFEFIENFDQFMELLNMLKSIFVGLSISVNERNVSITIVIEPITPCFFECKMNSVSSWRSPNSPCNPGHLVVVG